MGPGCGKLMSKSNHESKVAIQVPCGKETGVGVGRGLCLKYAIPPKQYLTLLPG